MIKKFQRRIEDFTCEHCGEQVKGNGYTNHCPKCLWSKHVDVNPGDRAAECGGLMIPVDLTVKGDGYILLHTCLTCGHVRRNKTTPEDSMEAIISLSKRI